MRKNIRKYFIGKFLSSTDPFERANAIILYQFSLVFFLIFFLQVYTDTTLGLHKAAIKHSVDIFLLGTMPFVMRYVKKLEHALNYFFIMAFITSFLATMMLNAQSLDGICVSRIMFFLLMSAMLQRGTARILYCCFFGWLPLFYVILNIKLRGALTWDLIVEPTSKELPTLPIFIAIVLGIYAIWNRTIVLGGAKQIIVDQKKEIEEKKKEIEEKNKDITDSLHYAKHIQQSLLPSEKYIHRVLTELNKK